MSKDNFQWNEELWSECLLLVRKVMDDFKASHQPKEQPIENKEWEILSGCAKDGGVHQWYNDNSHGGQSCFEQGCQIRSVKRLSDKEVFTVGDEVECTEAGNSYKYQKIEKFIIADDGHMRVSCAGVGCSIRYIKKLPPTSQPKTDRIESLWGDWLDNLVDEIPQRKSIIKEILLGAKFYSEEQLTQARIDAFNAARKNDVNSLSHFDQRPYPLYPTAQLYINSLNK